MNNWHTRYSFPISFETGPISWDEPAFNQLFIRTRIYDDIDKLLDNIQGQHGKFWISSPSGGYGKSTMLQYIARRLYCDIGRSGVLPFHLSLGKKSPTVEATFYRSFLNEFFELPDYVTTASKISDCFLPTQTKEKVSQLEPWCKEIYKVRDKMAGLSAIELENRFDYVNQNFLKPWTDTGIFSKYVLLIDEMDKLDATDALSFLSENQKNFEKLYKNLGFVAFLCGHRSWVEMLRDGTEYSFYRGQIFDIPPFIDTSDIGKLVETRLALYAHMIPSDNPWTEDGYRKLRELTGGIPRIMIELAARVTNEAKELDMENIGSGIVEKVLFTGEYRDQIEVYLKSNIETYLKLKAACDKHADSLLYIFYDMPGHLILKDYDKSLTKRAKYLGIELNDEEWVGKVETLSRLRCLSETDTVRVLAKDICDLFDKLSKCPGLIEKIVPEVIKEIGDLEPSPGEVAPPDFQKSIEDLFRRSSKQWFDKETLFEQFRDMTSVTPYAKALEKKGNIDRSLERIFEREFQKYVSRSSANLMVFEGDGKCYYRQLPEAMSETDYSSISGLRSREVLDGYINLVLSPTIYDRDTIMKVDQLIEKVLSILASAGGIDLQEISIRKMGRSKIFRELQLDHDLRRHIEFYLRETKGKIDEKDIPIIQKVAERTLVDLAKEYHNVITRPRVRIPNVNELIGRREDGSIERKSSMCWDYREGKKSEIIEFEIAKTVAAFMNAEGGYLIVGIDDEGHSLGIEKDFEVIKKPNADGFELHFTGLVGSYLGKPKRAYTRMSFETSEGKAVAIIKVEKSPRPVFVKHEGRKEFYVREGNLSQPLDPEEQSEYISGHWKKSSQT